MQLDNQSLLRHQGFIAGKWVTVSTGANFAVYNPFDGSVLATLPDMGRAETAQAIEAAQQAFLVWSVMPIAERKQILDRWVQSIRANLDDLAFILTSEQGKPLAEAKAEYEYTLERMQFYVDESLRIHGQTLQPVAPGKITFVLRQPFGVTAGIAPWNFPASTMMNKIAAALAAANTIVVKPAQDTPLTTLAVAYLGEQAGLPKGVLNVVLADNPKAIGDELTTHPLVQKFSFTGSTTVGKQLYSQCASTVKNIGLELGGNSPFIVFADADIAAAAKEGAALKFRNCGQVCVNANRFLVHEDAVEQFVAQFTAHAKALILGSGLDPATTMGPMINAKGVQKVEELVADAIAKGATVVTGGKRSSVGNLFYEPTVLTNMSTKMRMYREEIFGPVAPIYTFKTEAEAIAMANDTEYGLAAYFYTQDLGRAWRVSAALQSGLVGVNAVTNFGAGPFGGYKQSGIGREQGRVNVLDEWCEVKTVAFNHKTQTL